jgi:hypothetical protein
MSEIKLLERYRVDRAQGLTVGGPEQLVVLVLKSNDDPREYSVALSKVDAMMLSIQLSAAASDAQSM